LAEYDENLQYETSLPTLNTTTTKANETKHATAIVKPIPAVSKYEKVKPYAGCISEANYQFFDVSKVDRDLGVSLKKPAFLSFNDGHNAWTFQFSICNLPYDLIPTDSSKTGRVKQSATVKSSKADGALAKFVEPTGPTGESLQAKTDRIANAKKEPSNYATEYTFGDPMFGAAYVTDNKYNGFYLKFTSKQNCTYDATKKKEIILQNKCNADKKAKVAYNYVTTASNECLSVF